MKLTKKQLLIGGVCVLATCTLSFFAYKKVKKILEENKVEEIDEEVVLRRQVELVEQEIQEREELRRQAMEEWAQADLEEEELANQDELFLNPEEDDKEWSLFRRWSKEELETLRYDKDSVEAFEQYKAMCLADVIDDDSYRIMMMLFEIPFEPMDKEDTAKDNIQDMRYDFFGDKSVYSEGKTMAELFLYMASLLKFDLDYDVDRSIKMFIRNLGWSGMHIFDDELVEMCDALVNFDYWEPDTDEFGIFGLVDNVKEDGTKMTKWLEQYWAYTAVELEIGELEEEEYEYDPEEAYPEDEDEY